jgi:Tfp pilus assembly protein PilN
MRLDLNLATQPYENARAFFLKWTTLLGAVALLTAALVWAAFSGWMHTRDLNRQIAEKRSDIAKLQQEEKAAEAILNQPQNLGVREKSTFLNEVIARKAFSWTQVFSEMETMMPPRVHVTSIRPELNADNQLEIRMTVAGDSRDKALELLRRMEDSKHFREARLSAETEGPEGIQFQISALYVPQRAEGTL